MTGANLLIDKLMPIMPGDVVYFGIGKYSTVTEADTAFASLPSPTVGEGEEPVARAAGSLRLT